MPALLRIILLAVPYSGPIETKALDSQLCGVLCANDRNLVHPVLSKTGKFAMWKIFERLTDVN